MTPEKRIDRLTNWQIGLFVGPIVLQALRFFTRDPQNELLNLTILIGRFVLTVFCLGLIVYLEVPKRKIRKEALGKPVVTESPPFDV